MKNPRYLTVLVGLLMLLFVQQAKSQVQTARYQSITSNTKAFYEYLPQGFSATNPQKYPFILFLHGMGELGDGSAAQLPMVLRNGIPKLINNGTFPKSFTVNGKTESFVIMSPQFVDWPTSNDINAIINYAINNYNVDPTRVYLTGLSMGGGAVWEFGGDEVNTTYPQKLAAMVPVCGASYPSVYRAKIISDNKIAVWAFHNDGDPTAPVFYTNDYVNYINTLVPPPAIPAKKTIFVSNSHDAWTKAYDPNYRENGMNMYEWMLQYKRGSIPPSYNTPPTVNAGLDKSMILPVSSVQLSATASDPDGTIASYSWTKTAGPAQFSLSSTSVAAPTLSNLVQGTYTFRLTVTDNQGATATDDINVVVNPAPTAGTKYVKVNIYGGTNPYSNAEWNNWNTYSSLSSGNLKYSDGSASVVNSTLSQQNSVSDNGMLAANMAPPEVIRYSSYSSSNRTLTISGLDNSKTYSLEIYPSRVGSSNNTSRFAIGATTVDVKTDDNINNKASFASVTPTNGQIIVNITKLNSYNYINGFMLTEIGSGSTTNTPPVVNAGADQSITLPVSSVQLSATATDKGVIASYVWTKTAGPAQFTFSSTSVASPTVSNLVAGTYTFRLTATDDQGASSFDDVNVVVNGTTTPPSSPAKFVRVNIFGGENPYSNTQWNNWNVFSSLSTGNLKYDDGSASTVNATLSQQNTISDNGTSINPVIAPKEVVRYASYSSSNRTLTISGLDNSKTYDLELYASRNGTSNNTSRFTVGTTTVDVLTDNNVSNKASFVSIVPVNGQIVVSIAKLNTYNYINGFTLIENATGTTTATAKSAGDAEIQTVALDVFPNPVQDRFVLQVNNSYTGQMKVQVVDLSGVVQKEFILSKSQAGASQTYLSIGDLKTGEYIITVQIGDWSDTKKISKL